VFFPHEVLSFSCHSTHLSLWRVFHASLKVRCLCLLSPCITLGTLRNWYTHTILPENRKQVPRRNFNEPAVRGRILLDLFEPTSLLILNERFQKPADPISYTTKFNTIQDYFMIPKTLLLDIIHCTAHPDSWKNMPTQNTHATLSHLYNSKTIDHNLLSLELFYPAHPPTHQSYTQDTHMPTAPHTSYSAQNLKPWRATIKEAFSKDMDEAAGKYLHAL